jgi:hypothetical protein
MSASVALRMCRSSEPAEDRINIMARMLLALRTAQSPRKGTAMFRSISLLIFVLLASAHFSHAQREIGNDEIKKVEKIPAPPPRQTPKGTRIAQKRTNGVLFVLTEPDTANVIIKNGRGEILKQEASDNGELRAELPRGTYIIEVTAAKYYPHTEPKVSVSPSQARTVKAYLKRTTGSVIIGLGQVESEATTILIDGQQPSSLKVKVNIMKEENQIELEDVPEGVHTMSINNPNIAEWRREKVQVSGGKKITVAPRFQMAVVNLTVKSEPGAEIYLDDRMLGKTSEQGEIRIPDQKPGQHTIRAEKDKFVSAQKTDNFKIGDAVIEVTLNRIKSSPEFSDYFTAGLGLWDAPKTWQVVHGRMTVKSSEVGLVKDKVWDDFKMEFDISLVNGRGAAWMVRARDKKNYYLFQLSGPAGTNPKTFQTYIYQNGQSKLLKSEFVVDDLSHSNDQIHIIIYAKGPTITHLIKLSSSHTANPEKLSTLTDSAFSFGTVGFGAIDGEEFVVRFVNVTPE